MRISRALIAAILFLPLLAQAVVASSTNYRLEADSINTAGGLSTSSGYRLEDTTGEIATGIGSSTNYAINAGYQQMLVSSLSLSIPGSITLSPNIPDTGGGAATGQGTWFVRTDNAAGYTMQIRAAGSPALSSGGNNFANFTPAGSDPDFTFTLLATAAEFGFTPEGTDIVTRYRDNGATCNTGSGDTTDRCWDALTTTDRLIAQSSAANHSGGTNTVVKFRAESGASNVQPAGSYTATATVTVLAR
jgi:hypothetical protein